MADADQMFEARHPIGPGGRLDISSPRGKVTVRGIDGPECRVEARYQLSSVAALAGFDADRILRLSRDDDRLGVDVREGGLLAVDLRIEVPRTASVRINSVSSDVEVRGLTGETRIRQVSGKARLFEMAGRLNLDTISGPIAVQGADVALKVSTASGPITIDAVQMSELELTTLSADISVSGGLRAEGTFRIESVSGDIRLMTATGFTATLRSLSGRVVADIPIRDEVRRGERVVTVGDGRAALHVRTVSGRLRLKDAVQPAEPGQLAEPAQLNQRAVPLLPPGPPQPPTPPALPMRSEPDQPLLEDPLATLLALERGEIDVDEASRRLARTSHG